MKLQQLLEELGVLDVNDLVDDLVGNPDVVVELDEDGQTAPILEVVDLQPTPSSPNIKVIRIAPF